MARLHAVVVTALTLAVCISANCQHFSNPVRVATPVDPDSIISGDLNGDGLPDLLWFNVTTTSSIGHVLLAQVGGGYISGQTFTIPGAPTGVPMCATADVTRDGKIDLICATLYSTSYSATVLVFPGNGDGTFAAPVTTPLGSQYGAGIILTLVGDLNADGIPDFILQDDYSTPAFVLLSDGHGGFLPTRNIPNSYNFDVPISADINGDGIPDILWPNGAGVALGTGNGSFAATLLSPYGVGQQPVTCAFHDMDGDGKLDAVCGYLITGNVDGTAFDILHGNGDGTFNPTPIAHMMFGSSAVSGSGVGDFLQPDMIRDVNGDGIPDILATAGDGLTVIMGEPGLKFKNPVPYALAYSGYNFTSRTSALEQYVDINADGVEDVIAAGPNGIYLLYGHADGTFGSAVTTKISEENGHIGVADFNGDGKPDIVSTGQPQTSLSFGIGDGTFAAPVPVTKSPFAPLSLIYVADFNGDGKPDLLSNDANSNYYLMLGNGDGTFASALPTTGLTGALKNTTVTADGTVPYALTADLNTDGKADFFVIVANSLSPTYSLVSALSAGNGTFKSVSTSYPAPPYGTSLYFTPVATVLSDFAHRGQLDAAYYLNQAVYVVRGNGDGSFSTSPTILPVPTVAGIEAGSFQALQSADMDGDGNQDLVFLSTFQAYPYYQGGPSCVFIYFGNGDGTFSSPVQAGCFTHNYSDLRVADLNGDGRPDIVLQTASSLNTYVVGEVDNLGSRTFGPEVNYTAGSLSGDLFVADVNLDGRPDLVFGNQQYASGYSANSVTVLLNESSATATGKLTSTPNPSYVGEPFSITVALIPPTSGTLYTGNITFYVDGNPIGSTPLSGNSATIAGPTNLAQGVHQLSASWPGDANNPSLNLNGSQTVLLYPLQISLTCSPNPSLIGQGVSLSTQFVAGPPVGVPGSTAPFTGTLSFYDGSILLQQQMVATQGTSFNVSTLTGGTHSLIATYSGDNVYATSTASCSQVVEKLPTTSNVSVSSSPIAGQPFAFTATVTPVSPTSSIPTGTVNFLVDGTIVGNAAVNPATGLANFNDSGITGGNHTVSCTYSGDNTFSSSICPAVSVGVTAAPSLLKLASAPNPAYTGTPIAITANLTGNGKAAIGDSVTFTISVGSTIISQSTVTTDSNGDAIFTATGLLPGTYTLMASFAGTLSLQSASSTPITQIVLINASNITLSPTPNPAYQGQVVTLVATVGNGGTTSSTPSGTVSFLDGTTTIATGTLDAKGVATVTTSTLALGTHSLTASYPSGTVFTGSVSSTVTEVILPSAFTMALSPATLTIASDKAGTTTIQLASVGNFSGPLALTYGTLPQYSTANISPSTVTLTAAGTAVSTLSLNTLSKADAAIPDRPGVPTSTIVYTASFFLLLPSVFLRRRKYSRIFILFTLGVFCQLCTACTNSFYIAHTVTPGTYMIPVTATDISGNSQTANLTVNVTP
ncbi:FG-GAP-like repeat-containing protein [Granulicella paludicola]|uniref:FG-GAP-like repeat-containing protein n=1 Tax=Granulicella paludicola TaxID=474951 RepID=UPI0021E0DBB6|nr:FG-GAP-like repeat-containing protein [Granulicella paludicola]